MTALIDRTLQFLKWPAALLAVAILPGTALAIVNLSRRIIEQPGPIMPFLCGCLVYVGLWYLLSRHRLLGTLFSTFEHELTHAFFAWATLHRVTGLRATWRRGGEVTIRGRGNWLITIAPYFFPTICFFLGPLLALVPPKSLIWVSGLIGLAFTYHIFSTRRETHSGQTDLQRVGFLFGWMFLPAANAISLGAVVAFSWGGVSPLQIFLTDVGRETWQLFGRLLGA